MDNLDRHIEIEREFISRIESFTTAKNRESVLQRHKETLGFLLELKELREKLHTPMSHMKLLSGNIHSVECSCGEVTRYKVPLMTLEDFECPKKGKHAGKI